jgi:hypothetical protein
MAILQEILDRAEQLAVGTRGDGFQSALIDSGYTAETIFPHAVRFTLCKMAANGEDLSDLITTKTIAITAGAATLAPDIIVENLKQAVFLNRSFVSWLPYSDFLRYRFNPQLSYFSYSGSSFFFKEPLSASFTGDIDVQVVAIPALPNNLADQILLSAKATESVILTIAAVLLGEISLTQLMNER